MTSQPTLQVEAAAVLAKVVEDESALPLERRSSSLRLRTVEVYNGFNVLLNSDHVAAAFPLASFLSEMVNVLGAFALEGKADSNIIPLMRSRAASAELPLGCAAAQPEGGKNEDYKEL
jgi:hypothetical protein